MGLRDVAVAVPALVDTPEANDIRIIREADVVAGAAADGVGVVERFQAIPLQ
jgi:hypothetical protein